MKRITPISICRIVVFSIMAVACQKENLDGKLIITAEKMGGDGKVAVTGRTSEWVDGDRIRINDQTKTISVSDGLATIDNTTDAVTAPYRAVYPETLVAGDADLTASVTATVTIPNEYDYVVSDSKQIVGMPMAACAASGSELKFKHLTAAVAIKLTNGFGGSLTIDEIAVQSDVSQICGTRTVDFTDESALTNQTANDADVTAEQKKVRITFDDAVGRRLVMGNNETEYVVVPVLPVSSSNHFTVIVKATYNSKQYVFAKTQTSGGALARNEMGYVPVTMSSGNEDVGILINSPDKYVDLVSYINGMTSGTNTVRVTIDGTIDFQGESVTPINLNANNVIINGINNARLTNLSVTGVSNCYGLTYSFNGASSLTINNLTIENITLPGNNGTSCYIGALCADTKGDITLNNCIVKNVSIGQASQELNAFFGGLIGYIYTNNSNTRTLNVNISNCDFIQDNTLINPSISRISDPTMGGLIGQINERSGYPIYIGIHNCNVKNSENSTFNMTLNLVSMSNNMYLGGLIGNCIMPSISSSYANLQIINTTSKINYNITRTNSNSICVGGFIGGYTGSNYPSTTDWNGNNIMGSIQYNVTGTSYVRQVVGKLEDNSNWSGRVTYNVAINQ